MTAAREIGSRIVDVQKTWQRIYNLDRDFIPDGSQFDALFADGTEPVVGGLAIKVMHTPGHTSAGVP